MKLIKLFMPWLTNKSGHYNAFLYRGLAILIIIQFISYNLYSQEEFCSQYNLEKVIKLNYPKSIKNTRHDIKIYYFNNQVFYYISDDNEDNNDTIEIFNYNIKNEVIISYKLGINKELFNKLEWKKVSQITGTNELIFITFYKDVFVFYKDENNDFKLKEQLKLLSSASDYFEFDGKDLLYYANFNYTGNNFSVLDIHSGKHIFNLIPNLDCKVFGSITPNSYYDFSNDFIVFSQSLSYEIDIYSPRMEKIQTIKYSKENWKNMSIDLLKSINESKNIHAAFKLVFESDEEYSSVMFIKFISKDEFIVYYALNGQLNKYFVDIWKYNNSTKMFLIEKENLSNKILYQVDSNLIFNTNNFPIPVQDRSFGKLLFFEKGLIIPAYTHDFSYIGLKKQDYLRKKEEFFLDNNPILQLYIYTRKD